MTTVTCATALCTGNLVDTMMVMVTVPVLELIYILEAQGFFSGYY